MPDIESYLRGLKIPNSAKADLWDVYMESPDENALALRVKDYGVDSAVKADLWDMKSGRPLPQAAKPEASAAKGLARAVLGQQFRPPAMPKAPAAPVLTDPEAPKRDELLSMPATPDPAGWRTLKEIDAAKNIAPPMPKVAVPFGLQQIPTPSRRSDIGDVGMAMGDTGEGMRRMAEFQTAGAKEAAAGAGQMVAPNQPLERRVMGASRAFRGGMQAALPAMLPIMGAAAMAAPAATAFGMVAGTAAQEGVERGAKAVGVPEGYARAAGDLAGLPGYMYGPFRALRPKVPTTTGVVDDAIAPPSSIADDVLTPEVPGPAPALATAPERKLIGTPAARVRRAITEPDAPTKRIVPEPTGDAPVRPDAADVAPQPQPSAQPATAPATVADTLTKLQDGADAPVPIGKLRDAGITDDQILEAWSPDGIALWESHLNAGHPDVKANPKDFLIHEGKAYNVAVHHPDAPSRRETQRGSFSRKPKEKKPEKRWRLEAFQNGEWTEWNTYPSYRAAARAESDISSGSMANAFGTGRVSTRINEYVKEPPATPSFKVDPKREGGGWTAAMDSADQYSHQVDTAKEWVRRGLYPDIESAMDAVRISPRRDTQRGSFSRKPVSNIDTGDRIDFPVTPDEVPEKGKTLFQQVYTAADKATTNMLDRMHPVKVLEHARAILDSEGNVSGVRREMKSGISADDSGYAHARSFSGHEGQVLDDMIRLERIVRSAPKKKFVVDGKNRQFLDVADAYAMLERHEERFLADATDVADLTAKAAAGDDAAAAALLQHKPYTAPKYSSFDEVRAAKAQFEQQFASEMPEIKRLNDEFRAEDDRLLQAWRDSGLGTQEWYDATKARNQMYVPFQRIKHLADNLESMPTGGKVMSVGSDTFMHRMEGSEDAVMSPLASRIRNRTILRKLIARNDTAKRVGALAKNPEYKGLVMPLKSGQKVEAGFDKISFIENGVKQEVAVPVEVAEALKTSEHLDLLTKAMSVPARVLRAGVTIAPNFMIRNAIRDYQTAVGAARLEGLGFTPMDWAKGFLGAMMRGVPEGKGFKIGGQVFDERMYREFLQSKGAFGGFYHHGDLAKTAAGMTKSRTAKVLKTVVNPIEMARIFGETVELAPRIGVMQKAGKQGASNFEAGMKAREGTVDFEMRGAAMRAVSAIVPFLNPRIQGVSNLYRAAKERPARTLTRLSVQVGIPWMAAYAWNRQHFDKEYDSISPYEKRGHLIWIYGDGRDADGNLTEAFKIPKGEVGPFLNTLEDMADYMMKKKPREWKAMIAETISDLSPIPFAEEGSVSARPAVSMLAPPPVKAGFEWLSNQNTFTGRDIVPAEMKNAEPWNQFKPGTPEYLKWLGKKTNLSPAKMQNTMGTMGGYIGRAASEPGKAKRVLFGDQTVRVEPADKGRSLSVNKEQSRDANLRVSATRLARENFGRIHGAKTSADRKAAFSEGIEAMRRDFPNEAEKELRTRYLRALDTEYKRQFPERKTPDSDPREVPLNAYERKMKGLSTQARARTLVTELDGMDPAERKEKWRRWKAIGIVTEKVIEEMRKTR